MCARLTRTKIVLQMPDQPDIHFILSRDAIQKLGKAKSSRGIAVCFVACVCECVPSVYPNMQDPCRALGAGQPSQQEPKPRGKVGAA